MQFARAKKLSNGLDMSPIIDCILQLLIFFMLTSSFSGGAITLSLPKAVTADHPDPNEIVLSMNAGGELFLGSDRVEIDSLIPRLQQETKGRAQTSVVFRGDEAIPYRMVVEVIDRVRRAGVARFRMAHAPLATPAP